MQQTQSGRIRPASVFTALLLAALSWISPHTLAQATPVSKTAITTITVNKQPIAVEIARTPSERSIGLMHRDHLAANEGMLFVFEHTARHCFWMKNTLIPLSIAFIDEQGKVINIRDMQAHSLESHCPDLPVTYALEMNQGWFERHDISAGTILQDLPTP